MKMNHLFNYLKKRKTNVLNRLITLLDLRINYRSQLKTLFNNVNKNCALAWKMDRLEIFMGTLLQLGTLGWGRMGSMMILGILIIGKLCS